MDQATAIKRRAQALIERGALKEAKAEYEKLLVLEPINPYAYILIGDLAARMGGRTEALQRYNQGAEAYESLGLHRNAIAVLKRLLRLEPAQVHHLRRLADLHAKEGLIAEAVAHYLDFAKRRMKDGGNETREALEAICRIGIPNVDAAARVSDLLCEIGQHERAARELLRLAQDLESRGHVERARMLRLRAGNIAADAGLGDVAALAPPPGGREALVPAGESSSSSWSATPSSTGVPAPGIDESSPPPDSVIPAAETEATGGLTVLPGLERTGGLFSPVATTPPALAQVLGEEGPSHERFGGGGMSSPPADPHREEDQAMSAALPPEQVTDDRTLASRGSLFADAAIEERAAPIETSSFDPPAGPGTPLASSPSPMEPSLFAGSSPSPLAAPMIDQASMFAGSKVAGGPLEISDEVASVFDRFRAGVAPQLGANDHATHYDLGITYMEMGVFSEAISEFRMALEGDGYRLRCLELLATCYSRLDRPDLAAAHWRAAVQEAGDGEGEPALRYELACALAAAGQIEEARDELCRVLSSDPTFHAARARLETLRG